MRKILLPLALGAVCLSSITASATTFREKYQLDKELKIQNELTDNRYASLRHQASRAESGLVTDPQGSESRYAMAVNIYLSNMGYAHAGGFGANVFISEEEGTFSSRAFTMNFFQQGYSVGEIEGDRVTFPSGQYIYDTANNEKAYMYAAYLGEDEAWPDIVDTFVLTKDENGCYKSEPGYYFVVMTEEEAEGGINEQTNIICYGTDYKFTPLPSDLAESKIPADAEVFETQLLANSLSDYGEQVIKDVTVGVSGDKIYIGGLTDYLPDSYLVGEKTGDNIFTFRSHQYLGYYDEGDYPYIYEFAMVNPMYYDPYTEWISYADAESVTMTFNEDCTLLTLEENAGIFNCAYADVSSWNEAYWGVLIGDFNGAYTPTDPVGVECYGSYGSPYLTFEWDNTSVEGMPMNGDKLWCEVIINGEPYQFTPEYYDGLPSATTRIYYNTSEVDGVYVGSWSTIYFPEYEDIFSEIKTIGVRIGYGSGEEEILTDIVYASGYEPIEDRAFVPSVASEVVYYTDYYNNIRFNFDGKDVEGNEIPSRLLSVEILLDGEPLVFKDSDYYFNGGDGDDVTIIGLSEYAPNYSSSLVNHFGDEYLISLWGHDELPEFKTLTVRTVCTGGDTLTYGENCEIELERVATPANPWNITYDADRGVLKFGALPIDTEGNGLAPWNYGYEVYVNGELYTFKGELYYLESDITVIPYEGFEYNYDFYLSTDYVYDEIDWTLLDKVVVMEVQMNKEDLNIQKIGVRAVYTDGEGKTTYSDIVNSDGSIDIPSAINSITSDNEEVKWYNLQGIEVANPSTGAIYLRQQDGKTSKVIVR